MKTFQFVNNKGNTVNIKANATVKDLAKVGVDKIRLVSPSKSAWRSGIFVL